MHRLRRQADVPHQRDVHAGDRLDPVGHASAAFELDRVRAPFLEQAARALDRLCAARVIGPERHVADHQRATAAAGDHPRVVDHLVERHGQGRVVALDAVAERVADQDRVDTSVIEDPREGVVVGGEDGDLSAFAFLLAKARNRRAALSHARALLRSRSVQWIQASGARMEVTGPPSAVSTGAPASGARRTRPAIRRR